MRNQPKSDFAKEELWRADARAFGFALLKHWHLFLSTTIGSGFAAFIAAWLQGMSGGGKVIPLRFNSI
jgi:hypothetical protein